MHRGRPHSMYHERIVLLSLRGMELVLFGGIDGGVVDVYNVKVGLLGWRVRQGRVDYGPDETRAGGVIGAMSAKEVEGGLEGVQGGELDKRELSGTQGKAGRKYQSI